MKISKETLQRIERIKIQWLITAKRLEALIEHFRQKSNDFSDEVTTERENPFYYLPFMNKGKAAYDNIFSFISKHDSFPIDELNKEIKKLEKHQKASQKEVNKMLFVISQFGLSPLRLWDTANFIKKCFSFWEMNSNTPLLTAVETVKKRLMALKIEMPFLVQNAQQEITRINKTYRADDVRLSFLLNDEYHKINTYKEAISKLKSSIDSLNSSKGEELKVALKHACHLVIQYYQNPEFFNSKNARDLWIAADSQYEKPRSRYQLFRKASSVKPLDNEPEVKNMEANKNKQLILQRK